MEFKNKSLQEVMNIMDEQVNQIENTPPETYKENSEFKFIDRFYHSALNRIKYKMPNPEGLLKETIKNSEVSIGDNIEEDDILKAADKYAELFDRVIGVVNKADEEWLDVSLLLGIELNI